MNVTHRLALGCLVAASLGASAAAASEAPAAPGPRPEVVSGRIVSADAESSSLVLAWTERREDAEPVERTRTVAWTGATLLRFKDEPATAATVSDIAAGVEATVRLEPGDAGEGSAVASEIWLHRARPARPESDEP